LGKAEKQKTTKKSQYLIQWLEFFSGRYLSISFYSLEKNLVFKSG